MFVDFTFSIEQFRMAQFFKRQNTVERMQWTYTRLCDSTCCDVKHLEWLKKNDFVVLTMNYIIIK